MKARKWRRSTGQTLEARRALLMVCAVQLPPVPPGHSRRVCQSSVGGPSERSRSSSSPGHTSQIDCFSKGCSWSGFWFGGWAVPSYAFLDDFYFVMFSERHTTKVLVEMCSVE